MKKYMVLFGILLIFGSFIYSCSSSISSLSSDFSETSELSSVSASHERAGLIKLMDQYLAALVNSDPSGIPFADDVIFVENIKRTPIGEGLWKTTTGGPTDYRIIVADPDAGEIAFMGLLEEKENPVFAAIRLHVVDHIITEIDHLVVHAEDERTLNPNLGKVRPALLASQPEREKTSRERMREIANSYYEAVVNGNGNLAPFADECQRWENGFITVNNQTIGVKNVEESGFPSFSWMKCGEQLNTGIMAYITAITDRRILAIDGEKGLVFAFSIFRHNGEPKVIKITGVPGMTEIPNKWGPFDVIAAHVFKIRNGKIFEIEAMGYREEHGVSNGWE